MKITNKTPTVIKQIKCEMDEMCFYQYLPIKIKNLPFDERHIPKQLTPIKKIVSTAMCDYIGRFGLDRYNKSFVYLTVKNLYHKGNREGWHIDGFMTNDINYIWSDKLPTIFNNGEFNLTEDDKISLKEMEEQAENRNSFCYGSNTLILLSGNEVHKVNEDELIGKRLFVKISFSEDEYDLKGNSVNYLIDYKFNYRDRNIDRNIPQKL